MPKKRVSEIFKELTFDKKLLGVGSLLLIASVFLPWYQDRDSFNTGDMFLGITGPLYLVGFSLLALGILNLFLLVSESSGRKVPYLPFKSSAIFLGSGLFVFYILMVVSSVYFHQKFGINITVKQSQFGMFSAFIAASLITIGGYMAGRDKKSLLKEFQQESEGKTEPLISMPTVPSQEKPKESIRQEPVFEQQPSVEQPGIDHQPEEVNEPNAEQPQAVKDETGKNVGESESDKNPPQPFRMDL